MFEVRVDLSGLDRLIRNVEDLEAEVTEAMAEEIKRGADAAVPVDTGALKRSGRIEDRKGGKAHAVVYGTDHVRYALAVHFGRGRGREFLRRPAMDRKRLEKVAVDAARKVLHRGMRS